LDIWRLVELVYAKRDILHIEVKLAISRLMTFHCVCCGWGLAG